MTRATRVALAAAFVLGCAGPVAEEAAGPPRTLSAGRYAMGTVLELTLVGRDAAALAAARDRVYREVERVEALVSSWRPESDVSRLNAAAGGAPLAVHPEVVALLRRSVALTHATRGSFDVTVGPLVRLWTGAAERGVPPAPEALEAARRRVGARALRFAPDGAVALGPGSVVNLGGVAKGWALDRAREVLGPAVEAALLNFGQSSTWALGSPPDAAGWRLLARAPDGGFAGVLTLRDRALSVSGSLGQWTEIGGRRYGHVIDPRSGRPLTRRRQALVVADDATAAEAFSKALLVLGAEEGIGLAEARPDCEALLLDADGRRWRTAGWDAATGFETAPPEGSRAR